MADYRVPPTLGRILDSLAKRLRALEVKGPPRYTNATRPAAADVPGLIILNTDSAKHQGSNGTAWTDLY